MPKSNPSIPLDDYAPVAARIESFYSNFPEGRITTKLLSDRHHEIVVKAFVYRRQEDTLPAATGLASERIGDGEINTYACLENTETSAIGRALANLGFAASRKRPSREEMEKVERAKRSVAYRPPPKRGLERVAETQSQTLRGLQQHHDLLLLIERAETFGCSAKRLDVIRNRMSTQPGLAADEYTRIENALRGWMRRHSRTIVT